MSVERHSGYFTVVCARCGARTTGEMTWGDAVRAKRGHGFRSRKIEGEWQDLCPDCLRAENGGDAAPESAPPAEKMTFAKLPEYCAARRVCDENGPCEHKALCETYCREYGEIPSREARGKR